MASSDQDLVVTESKSPEERRDEANRLWAHALHEDSDFVQRNNFFLLAESMLIVAYSGLLTGGLTSSTQASADKIVWAARVIAAFGFLMTIVWLYVGRRQRRYTRHVFDRAAQKAPEVRETYESFRGARFSGSAVMVYAVTSLSAAMWLILLALVSVTRTVP